jgi:hypothetical protein
MIRTSSLYEACHELFAAYPLAARALNHSGTIRSMVLMLQDGDNAGFFVLSNDCGEGRPSYSLRPWPAGGIVDIEADGSPVVPDVVVKAVTRGVPIPRDGSLFGWTCGDAITALVVVYAEYTSVHPEPGWAVMPRAGISEAQWPPFTGERLFGHWSWEHYRAGSIVSLDSLIAGNPDTVFWTDTTATLGSNCCAVGRDIRSPKGPTLQRGGYVYYQVLRAGKPVPSLGMLLADTSKIDLAPRFRHSGHSDGWPQGSS